MHPSAQKLDIDQKRIQYESFIKELQYKVDILKKGIAHIDAGGDILEDKGMLVDEVQKIMCERLIDLVL